ncbi:MAG: DNA translocase FtsK [Fidelibacterota bacterium]
MKERRRQEILGIMLMAVAVLVFLSMISFNPDEEPGNIIFQLRTDNYMGILGVYVSYYLIEYFLGYPSFVVPLIIALWGWWLFSGRNYRKLLKSSIYLLVYSLLLSTALGMPEAFSDEGLEIGYQISGLVGGLLAQFIYDFLGKVGSIIVLTSLFLVTLRGYFSWNFYPILRAAGFPFISAGRYAARSIGNIKERRIEKRRQKQLLKEKKRLEIEREAEAAEPAAVGESPVEVEKLMERAEAVEEEIPPEEEAPQLEAEEIRPTISAGEVLEEYQLPPIDLLDKPPDYEEGTDREELRENARILESTLADFGVQARVVQINPGPIITRYEVAPATGVKINRIVNLADDLALVMKAMRVRIIAPIPGKAAVGVEIPNRKPSTVYLRSIIDSDEFKSVDSVLNIALAKTAAGEPYCVDLKDMPHILIAGSTGSGKSICINTIIISFLYRAKPRDVQFILIDPKKLELSVYKKLENYFLVPTPDLDEVVVTRPENAVAVLRAAEVEMEKRYEILAEAGVRNIDDYNRKFPRENEERLNYLIIIIDELADLMITAAKEIEEPIARLTQMSRAVGIHLIVATQRPSVDVLTGVIKANFPARMAFQVASKTDSRTILDMNGAEKLLGKGDMLFLPPASPEPIRLHNAFISSEEIERVLNFIAKQPKQLHPAEMKTIKEMKAAESRYGVKERDSLYHEALRLVVTHQQGSISLLQRRLRIGYSRAARLIDELEQDGIVGEFEGSKARKVLVDEDYLRDKDRKEEDSSK